MSLFYQWLTQVNQLGVSRIIELNNVVVDYGIGLELFCFFYIMSVMFEKPPQTR